MKDELYLPVKKVSLIDILPNNKPPHSKSHVIMDKETGDILHFCSVEYKVNSNEDIFKPMEQLFNKYKIKFTKFVKIISRTKFYVDYVLKIKNKAGEKLPGLLPCISVWNSYDGSLKHQIHFNYYFKKEHIKIPSPTSHSIDCCSKHCHEHLEAYIKNGKKDFAFYNKMNDIPAGPELINKVGKKLKLSSEIKKSSIKNLETEIKEGLKSSLFSVYMAINRAIVTCNQKEVPEFKYKRKKALLLEFLAINLK